MKKNYLILAVVMLGMMIVSCSGSHNSPKQAVRGFCHAFYIEDDMEEALKYTTGEAYEQLSNAMSLRNEITDYDFMKENYPDLKYDIENVDIRGNVATATVELSLKHAGNENYRMREQIQLLKVDGKWYVSEF